MNSWCKHCARKDYCYTTTVRPKCFMPMVNSTCNTSPIVRIEDICLKDKKDCVFCERLENCKALVKALNEENDYI